MEKYLLGVDIGTTGAKAQLYSTETGLVAGDYMGYALRADEPGHCEQDAEDWWRAVVKTVRAVCAGRGAAENITALSLSTQGGTLVPVDENFTPVHPAIVWNDARCAAQAKAFRESLGQDYMYRTSGWGLGTGLNALEIQWLRQNKPEVYERARYFLSVPDYISAKLTGLPVVDISNVGINQLADIRQSAYDENILRFLGIDAGRLAPIVPSGRPIGRLTARAAEELGINRDALLVSGAHDQYACAAGAGCFTPGDILLGTGTAWVLTTLSEQPDFESGFAQSRAATGGLWGSMFSLSDGGICLEWLRNNILTGEDEKPPYSRIDQQAAQKPIGSNGLLFYPYFGGCGYPQRDFTSKAAFLGLNLAHDRYDMSRAVMEGVTFQIAWIMESFQERMQVSGLKVSGGAAKSGFWSQMIADVTGLPVQVPSVTDLACAGAALLAGLGAGVFSSEQAGYRQLGIRQQTLAPIPENVRRYSEIFRKYKTLATPLRVLYVTEEEITHQKLEGQK